VGTDISLSIISDATYELPHILHGIQHFYSPRGYVRGA